MKRATWAIIWVLGGISFLLAGVPGALGQDASPSPTPVNSRIPMWRATLPGGVYDIAIRNIISVSTHEYIVDGAARVTEMNIETGGDTEVRFYYIEPLTPSTPDGIGQSAVDKIQELGQEVTSRVDSDNRVWEKVVKNYPTTTHAHTVEYRLDSLDDLENLFNSADTAFRLNQDTQIVISGS